MPERERSRKRLCAARRPLEAIEQRDDCGEGERPRDVATVRKQMVELRPAIHRPTERDEQQQRQERQRGNARDGPLEPCLEIGKHARRRSEETDEKRETRLRRSPTLDLSPASEKPPCVAPSEE